VNDAGGWNLSVMVVWGYSAVKGVRISADPLHIGSLANVIPGAYGVAGAMVGALAM